MKRYILAMTGATGSALGVAVLRELLRESQVHLLVSSQTFSILFEETGIDWRGDTGAAIQERVRNVMGSPNIAYHHEGDFRAPVASGSFRTDGMAVVPCSMKTLSGIANGYANTLIERAADVTIKEGRPLVLAPRETPYSVIHLENMLRLARIGVRIVPPVMGFYHSPSCLEDMVRFAAGKILDSMGVEHSLYRRWGG